MDAIEILTNLKNVLTQAQDMQVNEQLMYQVQFRIANKLTTELKNNSAAVVPSQGARWFAEEIACAITIKIEATLNQVAQNLLFEVADLFADVTLNYWLTFQSDYGINNDHAADLFIRTVASDLTLELTA